jgi:hypothetical protein
MYLCKFKRYILIAPVAQYCASRCNGNILNIKNTHETAAQPYNIMPAAPTETDPHMLSCKQTMLLVAKTSHNTQSARCYATSNQDRTPLAAAACCARSITGHRPVTPVTVCCRQGMYDMRNYAAVREGNHGTSEIS